MHYGAPLLSNALTIHRLPNKVQREKQSSILVRNGKKVVDHFIVPVDTTEAEVDRMKEVSNGQLRIADRVFPLHYPVNTEFYYGGLRSSSMRSQGKWRLAVWSRGRPLAPEFIKQT